MALDLDRAIYSHHLVFRRTERWLDLTDSAKGAAAAAARRVLEACERDVHVRGAYSAAGLRADSDLVLWLLSNRAEATQDLAVKLRRTPLGRALELSWVFWGVTRPAEFSPDHKPAFQKGVPPLAYLCLYPFVRTPDWYLLPPAERGNLLREHGAFGREFPQVLTNTTHAFGLGDWEWILAFEAETPDLFVDLIRRLREAEARRFTKVETPFITCRRKELEAAIADLG